MIMRKKILGHIEYIFLHNNDSKINQQKRGDTEKHIMVWLFYISPSVNLRLSVNILFGSLFSGQGDEMKESE